MCSFAGGPGGLGERVVYGRCGWSLDEFAARAARSGTTCGPGGMGQIVSEAVLWRGAKQVRLARIWRQGFLVKILAEQMQFFKMNMR